MTTAKMMRRGAAEANAESDEIGRAKKIGEVLGVLAVDIARVSMLAARVEALEKRIAHLENGTTP